MDYIRALFIIVLGGYQILLVLANGGRGSYGSSDGADGAVIRANGVGSISNGMYFPEGFGKPGVPLSQMSSYGNGMSADVNAHLHDIEKSLGNLKTHLGAFGGTGSTATINNYQGSVRGKGNGGVFSTEAGNLNGDGNSGYSYSSFSGSTSNSGNYYTITTTQNSNNGPCQEEVKIQGNDYQETKYINDAFKTSCKAGGTREVYCSGPEALVGDPYEDFCLYTQLDMPMQVIVIEDGHCSLKTYNEGSRNPIHTMTPEDCGKMKEIITEIKGAFENADAGYEDEVQLKNSKAQLKDLVRAPGLGVSPSSTSQNTPSQTPGGQQYKASPTPRQEKKPGFFKRICIWVKNSFMQLTGKQTKNT